MLQWGHVFSDVEIGTQPSSVYLPSAKLQWGHVFSDVEMADAGFFDNAEDDASMGPRLFRRGNSIAVTSRTP